MITASNDTLRSRVRHAVSRLVYRLVGIRSGPAMLRTRRAEWLYLDPSGSIWRLTPTGDRYCPLMISLEHD